jgi:protein-tyrosine kinase
MTRAISFGEQVMERIEAALHRTKDQRFPIVPASQVDVPPTQLANNASWSRLRVLNLDPKLLARNRVVTVNRVDPAHVPFDMLRTRLLQKMREQGWTTVAVTSPTPGCGKSVVALNLVFSLAKQRECRTVLMDLDLRRPQLANLLGLTNAPSIETFLRGQGDVEELFVRCSENVAVAANSRPVRLSAELLQSPSAMSCLKELNRKLDPHVVVFDLPPMLSSDDVTAFVPNVDCALLVVAAESTTPREVDLCERELAEKTNVVGVVLNKCRYTPDKYGY